MRAFVSVMLALVFSSQAMAQSDMDRAREVWTQGYNMTREIDPSASDALIKDTLREYSKKRFTQCMEESVDRFSVQQDPAETIIAAAKGQCQFERKTWEYAIFRSFMVLNMGVTYEVAEMQGNREFSDIHEALLARIMKIRSKH